MHNKMLLDCVCMNGLSQDSLIWQLLKQRDELAAQASEVAAAYRSEIQVRSRISSEGSPAFSTARPSISGNMFNMMLCRQTRAYPASST
jgi:hypothetical protein